MESAIAMVHKLTIMFDIIGASKFQLLTVSEDFFTKIKNETFSEIFENSQIGLRIDNYFIIFIKGV